MSAAAVAYFVRDDRVFVSSEGSNRAKETDESG